MPPKKKKGKKKAKKKDKNKEADAEKPKMVDEKPEYVDPVKDAPVAKIKLYLASTATPFLNANWEAPISTRLSAVFRGIVALHGGSIENVRVSALAWLDDQAYSDPSLTL